ncbi:MAG: hypothetical protein HY304_09730 [candidate division Zixibacteria bacterium]|nr:hypothetical protein [candidate division Zixibacteria bacterium]
METLKRGRSLERRVAVLSWVSAVLVIALVVLAYYSQSRTKHLETLRVRRIDFVDEQGRSRLTVATPLPNPVVRGTEFPRSTNVYGLQFKDSLGNEVGGLGIEDNIKARMLCFDYETAEAMCLTKYQDEVEISMFNKPPASAAVGQTGAQRIAMGVSAAHKTAFLVLFDQSGRERIRLSVDSADVPRIALLDADGNLLYSIPQAQESPPAGGGEGP